MVLLNNGQNCSEPKVKNHQIDGNILKLSKPSKYGNITYGSGNDSRYGKI